MSPLPATVKVSASCGPLRLRAVACRAGEDLSVTITGGDRPHVGCVVMARAHPSSDDPRRTSVTSSILAIPPHREEGLARPLAETLARELGGTVVVAAGVHTDRLSKRGVAEYLKLGDEIAEKLLQRLGP